MLKKENGYQMKVWAENETELGYILDAIQRERLDYTVEREYMEVESRRNYRGYSDGHVVRFSGEWGERWVVTVTATRSQCESYANTAIFRLVSIAKEKYENEVEMNKDLKDENKRLKEELEKLRKKNEKKEEKA